MPEPVLPADRARRFVAEHARPVDQALLAGDLDRLVAELARFQTPEGGFGHGLEPDVRTPAPSAICASIAFQYLRAAGAPPALPLARAAVAWLVEALDREAWVWPAVDARVSEGPHAPWWTPGHDTFQGYALNPSAELLGYLYDHRDEVPAELLAGVTARVRRALAGTPVIESPYAIACCARLAASAHLPEAFRAELEASLAAALTAADPDDPHLNLLRIVPTPTSFGHALVRDALARQAERLLAAQGEDGGWRPGWEPWNADAHREWAGEITVRNLLGLMAHGYL